MKSKFIQSARLLSTHLKFLLITLVLIGIFFRYFNLDQKVYWNDEIYTSLRVSGYTEAEVLEQAFSGNVIRVQDLQKYQYPNSDKTAIDTVKSLAAEESQHPPLYFLLARFWVQLFGDSVAVTRSLSVLMSLLVLPCAYWLGLELFESPLVGWMAIALLAVSPYQVLYAQIARQVSLWSLTILLASVALLRAMRLKSKLSWGVYAVSLALNFYTFPLSFCFAIAHGIYVLATENFRWSKTLATYCLALISGTILFIPWLLVILLNSSTVKGTTDWSSNSPGIFGLLNSWVNDLSKMFLDFDADFYFEFNSLHPYAIGILATVLLASYSLYWLCCQTQRRVWLFILTLVGVPFLFLLLPDLILGGKRSAVIRYLTPTWLGIQLSVAFLLVSKMTAVEVWRHRKWQLLTIALFLGGVLSCASSFSAAVWWHNSPSKSKFNPQVAQIVNQSPKPPLIVSDTRVDNLLALSHLLEPEVGLQAKAMCFTACSNRSLTSEPPSFAVATEEFSDIFVYRPSDKLQAQLINEQGYKLEPVNEWLWTLRK